MLESWDQAIVTTVGLASYVAPFWGKVVHRDRPYHGFVLNDGVADKTICFSDGTVLKTGPNELHYLPKGADYRVESSAVGGCWAINFLLLEEISEQPFSLPVRNYDAVLKLFKEAAAAWKERSETCNALNRKIIYELIVRIRKESRRGYLPSQKELLIRPAVEAIHRDFTKGELSVQALAEQCGISEAYFRRIFTEKFSVSPKAYIIRQRMEYACRLLESRQFSVSEVAQMCGYLEPCHFSREFKRYYDVSPADFTRASRD